MWFLRRVFFIFPRVKLSRPGTPSSRGQLTICLFFAHPAHGIPCFVTDMASAKIKSELAGGNAWVGGPALCSICVLNSLPLCQSERVLRHISLALRCAHSIQCSILNSEFRVDAVSKLNPLDPRHHRGFQGAAFFLGFFLRFSLV